MGHLEVKMAEFAKNVMNTVYHTICAELAPHLQKIEQNISQLKGATGGASEYGDGGCGAT